MRDRLSFHCPECDAEVIKGVQGCGRCGAKLDWEGAVDDSGSPVIDDGTQFRSGHTRAMAVQRLLGVCIFLAMLSGAFVLSRIQSISRIQHMGIAISLPPPSGSSISSLI